MSKILVVDDFALARESVAKLLEYEGYTALRAKDVREGLAMVNNAAPDLVLLDLVMPGMDGVGLLKALRRDPQWKDLPVIVLTGATDDEKLISRAWELKVQDLSPKASFGFDDLLARVKQHLPQLAEARGA